MPSANRCYRLQNCDRADQAGLSIVDHSRATVECLEVAVTSVRTSPLVGLTSSPVRRERGCFSQNRSVRAEFPREAGDTSLADPARPLGRRTIPRSRSSACDRVHSSLTSSRTDSERTRISANPRSRSANGCTDRICCVSVAVCIAFSADRSARPRIVRRLVDVCRVCVSGTDVAAASRQHDQLANALTHPRHLAKRPTPRPFPGPLVNSPLKQLLPAK